MKKEKNYLYKVLKVICTILLKILFRPTVLGKENIPKEGPIIFAGNHIGAIDPVIVMTSTNRIVRYMAKNELFKGLHGIIFKRIGLIPVYRDRANPVAMERAERVLNNGGTIGIFPEGTRNRTQQELLPLRKGCVRIAKRTKSTIVPFAIRGKYKLFRKGITLEFGQPIKIENMEIEEANEKLREEIIKLLRK